MKATIASREQASAQIESSHAVPVLIIGCGFGGIAMAIALQKAGIEEFTILERASDVGGVWHDNSYPGAACDVASRLYSLSGDSDFDWSGPFAPRDEILSYIHECVRRHGIREHVHFDTEVLGADFDEASGIWTVETAAGKRYTTPILISAIGLFSNPSIPSFPGRERFKGAQFHSARWDHDCDLAGKRVAVFGNGASAIQIVPQIAPKVEKLLLFQRSPQYVMPRSAFPGSSKWDLRLERHPSLRWLARMKIFFTFERFILARRKPEMRLKGEAAFRAILEAKVKDPELRRKLTPTYPMGCKRQLVSDKWYDALVRPNVEVINDPVAAVEPEGVRTQDEALRPVDVIIYATGFSTTSFLTPTRIKGLDGKELNEIWRDGAEAYLGISVTGFPNFFMLYGPNTNVGGSIIHMLECQARYVVSAIRALRRRRVRYMNLRADVQKHFNDKLQERLSRTVSARTDCLTYYKAPNGRITTQWPGYALEYRFRTHSVRSGDYEFV